MKSRIANNLALVAPLLMLARPVLVAADIQIVVNGNLLGNSIEYSGVNGQMSYNSTQLDDVGFNSWRIWDDLNDFESQDDNVWDNSMGNHRSFFDQLKADNVELYLSMRNTCWGCQWLTKPPQSDADWNEWWEHVFAEIYWLNVRNDYQFDFFEVGIRSSIIHAWVKVLTHICANCQIFNEPDNSGQGWGGTEAQYLQFAAVTADAINFLYEKYIPDRKPRILGPAVDYPQVPSDSSVPGGKGWIDDLLGLEPAAINAISFHSYLTLSELTWGVNYAHGLAANHGNSDMPVWISELGTYDQLGNGAAQ
ncbi:glycoside hydrolase superfamily [Endogone sp. FLAS-F59071]|nr:glycoside hydrolase superfamily [Endogone sp. FLAS-F59071]|eukprot:RUS15937.1 glycoside hydrolase superfamily [Endogone sp. FLAS-F59071]